MRLLPCQITTVLFSFLKGKKLNSNTTILPLHATLLYAGLWHLGCIHTKSGQEIWTPALT